jgi:hypothetical protein
MFSNTSSDKATEMLEDARIDSQYQTIPFKDIKRRIAACGSTGGINGYYTDCRAVHWKTGRALMVSVLAQNEDGALRQMQKYIGVWLKFELSDFTLFIGNGDKTRLAYNDCRMRILGTR